MTEQIKVWDVPVRVFHWLLAGSFVGAYIVGESDSLRNIHMILGYTAMELIVFRIVWGFVGSRFACFRSFLFPPRAAVEYLRRLLTRKPQRFIGHNPAGSYAIYAILLLGLATGLTGYLTVDGVGGESMNALHGVLANVWLGVVIVHIAGVFLGSWIQRENLARAMVTGYKTCSLSEADGLAPGTHRAVGVALGIAVVLFWIWGFLSSLMIGGGEQAVQEKSERGNRLEWAKQPSRAEPNTPAASKPDAGNRR